MIRQGVARKRAAARTRATRIPDDFAVTPAMVEWARREVPHVDGRRQTEQFMDHFKAASGANARKNDWEAAWRKWMRKADDDLGHRPGRGHLALASGQGPTRVPTTTQRVQAALAFLDPEEP